MTVPRLFAIALIIVGTSVAWFILGGSVMIRTGESDAHLGREVAQIWGGRHEQAAPKVWFGRPRLVVEQAASEPVRPEQAGSAGTAPDASASPAPVTRTAVDRVPLPIVSSRLDVSLNLDQRRRGLLWYDTYGVSFAGEYRLRNTDPAAQDVFVHFDFPSKEALYDAFVFRLNGVDLGDVGDVSQGITAHIPLPPGGEADLAVSYRSRGLGDWSYSFAPSSVAQVRDFAMDLVTDCDRVDFPIGSISPTRKTRTGNGWALGWDFENLVTGQRIGVDLPNRLNPGPVAARIIFFAPVSLLFFVTVLVVVGILSGESLHPMHYFFLSTAIFAFHLLLAYLVDHLDIHLSFLIASATSVALVISYLRLVSGMRFALLRAGLAQSIFLVLFSYSFFFEGYTGLSVTVGSVLTLFVLMQATARLDWAEAFTVKTAPTQKGNARN